uniref:Sulfotransferase domain-containing protein n=1 Tax=Noctiluca scintillans TaxID=2966 RepID=A0A7S1EZT3_NOCSC|mmetsp:Transcript_22742/g.59942  ORF Transcript_22742/g.59942 Transcript_22742/m.59942 type:complete len:343 (+) Transcript_22742:45-1073(+)
MVCFHHPMRVLVTVLLAAHGHGKTLLASTSTVSNNFSTSMFGLTRILHENLVGCSVPDDENEDAWPRDALVQVGRPALLFQRSLRGGKRRPIMWVHLHNFGGTYMCMEAMRQGEHTPPNADWPGCLVDGDGCSTQSGRTTCAARAKKSYSFTMVERDVEAADLCDDALLGVTLRDPLAGLTSTLVANQFKKEQVLNILRTGKNAPARHLECLPSWDTYHHFDNFATRSLGGNYNAPPRGVTRENLERAKKNLERIDVVLILEELQQHMPQLAAFFEWDIEKATPQNKEKGHQCTQKDRAFTAEEETFLKEVNALDYELFQFGRQLAANRTISAHHILHDRLR